MLAEYKILVVDDDDDNRQLIAAVLRLAGAEVMEASSAQQAYELATHAALDLLISDIAMPGADGYELVRRVLADCPDPPVAIALSGHARDQDREKSLRAGFESHLTKPIAPVELVAHVRERLAARPRTRERIG